MNDNLALIAALILPALAFIILRINASLIFLSLCLGAVLVQYVASEAVTLVHLMTANPNQISLSGMKLLLFVAPAAVTTVVTLFSIHGRIKHAFNILPAFAASSLLVLLAVPLLPPGISHTLQIQQTWHILSNAESLAVAAGAVVCLFFLWTQRRFFQGEEKHRR